MNMLWVAAQKICSLSGMRASGTFLFLNTVMWGVIALFASAVVDASKILDSINTFDIYFIIVGYSVIIMGFFGGSLFIMRNE